MDREGEAMTGPSQAIGFEPVAEEVHRIRGCPNRRLPPLQDGSIDCDWLLHHQHHQSGPTEDDSPATENGAPTTMKPTAPTKHQQRQRIMLAGGEHSPRSDFIEEGFEDLSKTMK